MAKKTSKKTNKQSLTVPCRFKKVGLGETLANIGLNIQRSDMDITTADQLFAFSRLTATLKADKKKTEDVPGQRMLGDGEESEETAPELKVVVDVKGFRAGQTAFSTSFVTNLDGLELAEFARFSGRNGRVTLKRTGDPEADDSDDGNVGDEPE